MSVPTYAAPVREEVGNETVELCEEDGVFDDEEYDMDAFLKHFENTHYMGEVAEPNTVSTASVTRTVAARSSAYAGTWIQESDGRWWYRHADGSYTTNDWEYINDNWYYFDGSGWMVTGWVHDNGHWYYCQPDPNYTAVPYGAMLKGWRQIEGQWYYFFENSGDTLFKEGEMTIGWICPGGVWYYCHGTDGYWIDNMGTRLIQEALKYQGLRYSSGGANLSTGVDCSGFVMEVTRIVQGESLSHHAATQYQEISHKISYAELQPGDLIFYNNGGNGIDHVAFYIGTFDKQPNRILHASSTRHQVTVGKSGGTVAGCATNWR